MFLEVGKTFKRAWIEIKKMVFGAVGTLLEQKIEKIDFIDI